MRIVLLALTILIWSGAFVAIKLALGELSPLGLTVLRFALASAGFGAVAAWRAVRGHRLRMPGRSLWTSILMIGLFGTAGYHIALNVGEASTGAGIAAVIVALSPAFTALIAQAMGLERPSGLTLAGLALAFVGVVVVSVLGKPGADLSIAGLAGPAIVVVAPICWAANTTVVKRLSGRIDPVDLTIVSTWSGTALVLALTPRTMGPELAGLSPEGWAAVLYLALAATVFGYLAWNLAVTAFTASSVASTLYFIPLITVMMAALMLGEAVTLWLVLGGAAIVIGVAMVDRGRSRAARGRSREAQRARLVGELDRP